MSSTTETSPVRALVPKQGWLGDFFEYADAVMMASDEFKLGVALASLSAAVGKGAWFRLGGSYKRWRCHLWILLVGGAGHRKSTPIELASQLTRETRGEPGVLPRQFTKEAFFDALQEAPDGFWDVGELPAFLGRGRSDYMAGINAELCDIWDGQGLSRRTRKEGLKRVTGTAVTAIATARPTDFEEHTGLQDFRSGFLSRFLILQATGTPAYIGIRAAGGVSDHVLDAHYAALKSDLADVGAYRGGDHQIHWTPDAIECFEMLDQPWNSQETTAELTGWASRRGIQTVKLASLHSFAANRTPSLTLEPEDVAWGAAVTNHHWNAAEAISVETVGLDRDGARRKRIFDGILTRARETDGSLSRRDAYRNTHRLIRGKRELEDMIDGWVEAGIFERGFIRPERGPKAAAIRLLNGKPAPANWEPLKSDHQADVHPIK
jgi:uncharacterized protein DUF3987